MEVLIRKWRPKVMASPECFYAKFDEERKAVERYDKAESMN